MPAASFAAVCASALLVLVAAFQGALAGGRPWGMAAYGGRVAAPDGSLPARYRRTSAVTAVTLVAVAVFLLAAGRVLDTGIAGRVLTVGSWVAVALFTLNTAANLSARHPMERWGLGAATALLTVLSLVIALSR